MFIIWVCVIAMNAYWLAPVGYFTLTQSKDYINAYNNISTTPLFVAKSVQYGTLQDTALLKSFLWEALNPRGAISALKITSLSRQSPLSDTHFLVLR